LVATADLAVVGEVIKVYLPPGGSAAELGLLKDEHEGVLSLYLSLIVKRMPYCILFILAYS
jgi:hypothetical protein